MKKCVSIIIIILAVVILFFYLNRTADEKVKGSWSYTYDKETGQSLQFISNKTGMYVRNEMDSEVFPLKNADKNQFNFLYQQKGDKNYIFKVRIVDKNSITIEPEAEKPHSLAELVVGTDSLGREAKKEKTITLKKDK